MKVELTRFRVKQGKSGRLDAWLQFLNDNKKAVLETLDGEKMYVETIFREELNGEEFLYWFSVQGDDGQEVDDSAHWIDKQHLLFWEECIDETFRPVDLNTAVVMIPEKILNNIK